MLRLNTHITPYYYQNAAKVAFYSRLKADKLARPIIEMETGSGKSIVLVDISIDAVNWGKRVLHLTHSETLVDQNSKALINCSDGHIDLSICCAGLKSYDLSGQVVFSSIQTLANRLADMRAFDLVIIDECHLISVYDDTQYQKVFTDLMLKNPKTRFLGLTATPYRLKQGWLHWAVVKRGADKPTPPFFTDICYKTDTAQLIKDGFLAEPITRAVAVSADLNGVTLATNGDYKSSEEGAEMSKIIPAAIKEVIATNSECKRGKSIIFASTIENAELIVHELHYYGIKCALVVSKNYDDFEEIDEHGKPLTDKSESLAWFSEPIDYDNPRYLVNVGMFVAGVNVPDIDHVVLLYATMSNSKLKQTVGRGFRTAKDKENFIVSDYGTNFSRLGTIDNPIIKASGNGECPTKQCQAVIQVIDEIEIKCNAHNLLTAKQCCECGAEFQIAGGNDKYTPLAEAAPLLSYQQADHEYYSPVTEWDFSEHTSNKGGKSLKLRFFNGDEHIGNHWFQIRADKSGWRAHNIELLHGFFYDDRDWFRYKPMFESESIETVATNLNAHYEMICKTIIGVKYKKDGIFVKIVDIELQELEQ